MTRIISGTRPPVIRIKPVLFAVFAKLTSAVRKGFLQKIVFGVHSAFLRSVLMESAKKRSTRPDVHNNKSPYRREVRINCGGKSYRWFKSDLWNERPALLNLKGNSWASSKIASFIGGPEPWNNYALRSLKVGENRIAFGYKPNYMENCIYQCQLRFAQTNSKYFKIGNYKWNFIITYRCVQRS